MWILRRIEDEMKQRDIASFYDLEYAYKTSEFLNLQEQEKKSNVRYYILTNSVQF